MRHALAAVALLLVLAPAASAELVFSSNRCDPDGTSCRASIWRSADDGSDLRRLTRHTDFRSGDGSPSWDLVGRRIFFTRSTEATGGEARIWSMAPDGTDERAMTSEGDGFFSEHNTAVSADGAHVAFDSTRGETGGQPQIWVMAADGSGLRRMTDEGGASRLPRFSPDGRRVIYLHYAGGVPGDVPSVRTRLLEGGPPLDVVDSSQAIGPFGLSFSYDGRSIALTMHGALYTIDGLTMQAKRRAPAASEVTWSLDGTLFYTQDSAMHRVGTGLLAEGPSLVTSDAYQPSWSALALELPSLPEVDDLAPALALPVVAGVPSLVAIDPSGLRSVEAAFAQRLAGRCRPVERGRLRGARTCARPAPFRRVNARGFDRTIKRLPRGRYRVWVRARDGAGNATTRPLRASFARRR
jgi:hypothetical protein